MIVDSHHPANCSTLKHQTARCLVTEDVKVTVQWFKPSWLYRHSAFQLLPSPSSSTSSSSSFLPIMIYVSTSELEVLGDTPGSCCELALFSLRSFVLASVIYSLFLTSSLYLFIFSFLFYQPHNSLMARASETASFPVSERGGLRFLAEVELVAGVGTEPESLSISRVIMGC